MAVFFGVYLSVAAVIVAAAFCLSYFGGEPNRFRGFLLALYILAVIGVLFATGVLEARYGWNRLYSSIVAAALLLALYLADSLGTRLQKR